MSNLPKIDELYRLAQQVLAEFWQVEHTVVSNWLHENGQQITIRLPFCCAALHEQLNTALAMALPEPEMLPAAFNLEQQIMAKPAKTKRLPKVKNIIAVGSGKGGVGKSTSAVNLAYALIAQGAKVGIVDGDIYGPSIPIMLGNQHEHPSSNDNKHMQPLMREQLASNSIGYLVAPEDAAIWRGPMASRALQQIINETLWPELDYLLVDLPPGTGDIQLTLAQQLPLTAAVIVTTPQDLALADGRKGIAMFNKVSVPVLGVLENMSFFQCSDCGHVEYVFAKDGAQKLASQYDVPLLGQLPLNSTIREHADGGDPLVLAEPDSPITQIYLDAAVALSKNLALMLPDDKNIAIDIVEKH